MFPPIWSFVDVVLAFCRTTSRLQNGMSHAVHQSLSGLAPTYLADDINLVADSDRRLLQSTADMTCRSTYTVHTTIRECGAIYRLSCYGQFRRELKTFLLVMNWPRRIVTVWLFAPYKYSYLLTFIPDWIGRQGNRQTDWHTDWRNPQRNL